MKVCPIRHYLKYYGPGIWYSLHVIAYNCDMNIIDREVFVQYISTMSVWLPCKKCRAHCQQYLRANPIPTSNLFKWSVDFHNAVNRRLKRQEYSYYEAFDMLHSIQSGCNK